jgi:hypothetical protein
MRPKTKVGIFPVTWGLLLACCGEGIKTNPLCANERFDRESNCSRCLGNWDLQTNCTKCKNHWIDMVDDCGTCPGNWDSNQDCAACIGEWDIETNCSECLPGWIGAECDCFPSCEKKICGDDGCGGSCGVCAATMTQCQDEDWTQIDFHSVCVQGQCVFEETSRQTCLRGCQGELCKPVECGLAADSCTHNADCCPDYFCNSDEQCEPRSCVGYGEKCEDSDECCCGFNCVSVCVPYYCDEFNSCTSTTKFGVERTTICKEHKCVCDYTKGIRQ